MGFSGDGKLVLNPSAGDDEARAVVVHSSGKIIAVGSRYVASGDTDAYVVRLNSDGTPDNTFNGTGVVEIPFTAGEDAAYAVALQTNSKIVVAGQAGPNFAFARLNTNGTFD